MERCAVIGVGQTQHTSCRADVSIAGLVREAVDRALADAHLTMADVDAIVIGKAPDMLEGVVMPELWLTDSLAAAGKPVFRVHTAGSVGGSTAIVAAQHVMAGIHGTVLAIGFEKQSDGNAMWALSVPIPFIEQADHNQAVTQARERLGEAVFTAIWAEGQAMTLEQSIAYASAADTG